MRKISGSPAAIILGILLLGFLIFLAINLLTLNKNDYYLEKYKPLFIWGKTLLLFLDSFAALQATGALLSYSLFLGLKPFFEHKAFNRALRAIFIPLIVLVVVYLILQEAFAPPLKRYLAEAQTLGRFSDNLFADAKQKKKEGDIIGALLDLRLSLAVDPDNPQKIEEKSLILSLLSDTDFKNYLTAINGLATTTKPDPEAMLELARQAFSKKDYEKAWTLSQQILALDSSNNEALRIATVAGEQSRQRVASQTDNTRRYLNERKRQGYAALTSANKRDVIEAYFLFLDLYHQFPFDDEVAKYLAQSRELLPSVSFFIEDAKRALGYQDLVKKNLVFFNRYTESEKELIVISSMVNIGKETFFKDIEVIRFFPDGQISMQFSAPLAKLLAVKEQNEEDYYLNFSGVDRFDPQKRTSVLPYLGIPDLNPFYGFKLNGRSAKAGSLPFNPQRLDYFSLDRTSFKDLSIPELIELFYILAQHAKVWELIGLELLERICQPLLLLILTFICLNIGLTQKARYLSSYPKLIYLWVLIIPLIMIPLGEIARLGYRMALHFCYYVLSPLFGSLVVLGFNLSLLILSLLVFLKKMASYKNA